MVLACEQGTIYGVIVNTYYFKFMAERRAAYLERQVVRGSKLWFKTQKNKCF